MSENTTIPDGILIKSGSTLTHVHTSDGTTDLEPLREYLNRYDDLDVKITDDSDD